MSHPPTRLCVMNHGAHCDCRTTVTVGDASTTLSNQQRRTIELVVIELVEMSKYRNVAMAGLYEKYKSDLSLCNWWNLSIFAGCKITLYATRKHRFAQVHGYGYRGDEQVDTRAAQ
jgi:hypothetical protein